MLVDVIAPPTHTATGATPMGEEFQGDASTETNLEQSKQFNWKYDFAELGEEVLKMLDAVGSTLALPDALAFRMIEHVPVKPYLAALYAIAAEENIRNCAAAILGGPPGYWGCTTSEGEVFSCTQRKAKTGDPFDDWAGWEPAQYGPFLKHSGTVTAYFGQVTEGRDNFVGSLQWADGGVEETCREFGWRLQLCTHCGLPLIANRPKNSLHDICKAPAGRARRLRWKDKNRDAVNKAAREAYRSKK